MRMFEKVTAALEEGGYFVFEPQDWDSYGHAVKKNRELKAAKEALKIMPEQFPEILERLGLQLEAVLTERKRPISIWKKI